MKIGIDVEALCNEYSRLPIGAPYLNPLKPKGKYMYHLLYHWMTLQFVFVGCVLFSASGISFLSSINQLIFVMVSRSK
jgi:hypothetical protein